jgi:hypothetical protein
MSEHKEAKTLAPDPISPNSERNPHYVEKPPLPTYLIAPLKAQSSCDIGGIDSPLTNSGHNAL